jgi:hypothetical protein
MSMQDQDSGQSPEPGFNEFQNSDSGNRATGTIVEKSRAKSREAAASVKQKAQQTKERVLNKGSEAVHQARDKTRAFAEDRKTQLGERIHGYGSAVHRAAEKLREEEDPNIAHYADMVAERLDQAADYVQSRDPGMILRDVENAARRRPEIFFGGMFLAGLVLSRFLKASSERDQSYVAESNEEYWMEDPGREEAYAEEMLEAPAPAEGTFPNPSSEGEWRGSTQPGGTI